MGGVELKPLRRGADRIDRQFARLQLAKVEHWTDQNDVPQLECVGVVPGDEAPPGKEGRLADRHALERVGQGPHGSAKFLW